MKKLVFVLAVLVSQEIFAQSNLMEPPVLITGGAYKVDWIAQVYGGSAYMMFNDLDISQAIGNRFLGDFLSTRYDQRCSLQRGTTKLDCKVLENFQVGPFAHDTKFADFVLTKAEKRAVIDQAVMALATDFVFDEVNAATSFTRIPCNNCSAQAVMFETSQKVTYQGQSHSMTYYCDDAGHSPSWRCIVKFGEYEFQNYGDGVDVRRADAIVPLWNEEYKINYSVSMDISGNILE